jgi:hypothetical protein
MLNAPALREEMKRLRGANLDAELEKIVANEDMTQEEKQQRRDEIDTKRGEDMTEQYIGTRDSQRRQSHSEEGAFERARHVLREKQGLAVADIVAGAAKVVAEAFLSPMFTQLTNFAIDTAMRVGKAIVAHFQRYLWAKDEVRRFYRFPELETRIPPPIRKGMKSAEKEEFILTHMLSFRSFRDCEKAIRYYTASRVYMNAAMYKPGSVISDFSSNALAILQAVGIGNARSTDPGQIALAMA